MCVYRLGVQNVQNWGGGKGVFLVMVNVFEKKMMEN